MKQPDVASPDEGAFSAITREHNVNVTSWKLIYPPGCSRCRGMCSKMTLHTSIAVFVYLISATPVYSSDSHSDLFVYEIEHKENAVVNLHGGRVWETNWKICYQWLWFSTTAPHNGAAGKKSAIPALVLLPAGLSWLSAAQSGSCLLQHD